MNKAQLDNIKSYTKDSRWQDIEILLREQIEEMLDIRNIDTKKDVDKQIYGRLEYAETLIKFLRKVKMISNEPIEVKSKKYI